LFAKTWIDSLSRFSAGVVGEAGIPVWLGVEELIGSKVGVERGVEVTFFCGSCITVRDGRWVVTIEGSVEAADGEGIGAGPLEQAERHKNKVARISRLRFVCMRTARNDTELRKLSNRQVIHIRGH
jgi:hypothetical protein